VRLGKARGVGRPGGRVAAAERGDGAWAGAADDGQREERGGLEVEGAVVVEEVRGVEARAGGELGRDAGGRRAGQAPGAAAVHEREAVRGRRAGRLDDPRQALADLLLGAGLHPAHAGAPKRLAGDIVADPGDLPLVGHEPGEPGAGPGLDLRREATGACGVVDRRALGAEPRQAPAQRPPAGINVHAHAHLRATRAHRPLDQVEVRRVVHHRNGCAGVIVRGQRHQLADRGPVHAGVCDHDVVEPLPGEPQRLGEREGEDPLEALVEGQDPSQHRDGANRLRGDADRQAGGLLQHAPGVRLERAEVDEGERRLDPGEDGVVACALRLEALGLAHGAASVPRMRRASGEPEGPERWPSG
jgi:hypothetical protein